MLLLQSDDMLVVGDSYGVRAPPVVFLNDRVWGVNIPLDPLNGGFLKVSAICMCTCKSMLHACALVLRVFELMCFGTELVFSIIP